MIRKFVLALGFAAVLLPGYPYAATTTIGALKDNTIFQQNSLNSAGGWVGMTAGTNGMGAPRRGLIAFDIAGNLPAGSTITAAQLTLYLADAPNSNSQNIGLYKLTRDWGEGTANNSSPSTSGTGMGAMASPGDATWSHAKLDEALWTSPGAGGDFNAVASSSVSVSGPVDTPFTWNSTAALVSDVQAWLDAPTTNFGWALINEGEATIRSQKTFHSRQATQNSSGVANSLDPTWRPSLVVTYTTSPETSGDYNGNGVVDAADYILWRDTLNLLAAPAGSGADGNESGTIDDGDLDYWKAHFGNSISGRGGASPIPEPWSVLQLFVISPLAFTRRHQ